MTISCCLLLALAAVRFDLGDLCKEYRVTLKSKAIERSLEILRDLVEEYSSAEGKEQKEVVKVIEATFPARKDEGEGVDRLFITAAAALGTMGEQGPAALVKATKLKHVQRMKPALAALVEAMGDQSLDSMVDPLLGFTKSKEPLGEDGEVLAAATRALARYDRAAGDTRKKIAEQLVDLYVQAEKDYLEEQEKEAPDDQADIQYNRLEPALLNALTRLTGRSFQNAVEWQSWYDEHEKEDWDS
jgi:hypothetical protein